MKKKKIGLDIREAICLFKRVLKDNNAYSAYLRNLRDKELGGLWKLRFEDVHLPIAHIDGFENLTMSVTALELIKRKCALPYFLYEAFPFSNTKEGETYWKEILNQLKDLQHQLLKERCAEMI